MTDDKTTENNTSCLQMCEVPQAPDSLHKKFQNSYNKTN